jgi:hypothetical protein
LIEEVEKEEGRKGEERGEKGKGSKRLKKGEGWTGRDEAR